VFKSVTLRLPAKLKVRVARAARQKGQSTARWMLEAIEHEVERRERFTAYVKQAQSADPALGPVEEIDARNRLRFWLDHLSSEKRVARSTSRRMR
jgi:predicted transcriptional regulator